MILLRQKITEGEKLVEERGHENIDRKLTDPPEGWRS